jgi:transposase, IS5 family
MGFIAIEEPAMRPPKPQSAPPQEDLFRSRLEAIIDMRHALVRLGKAIDWQVFDDTFGALYDDANGRPGLPTRLMVGLHMIKHMDGISDEAVCARFLDSPYVQHFCGEAFFRHDLVLDRSSMTQWRKRTGADKLEILLGESLAVATRTGAASKRHMARITVDTTVQEKAVAHPNDARLLLRALETLVGLAKDNGVTLRQTYKRTAKWMALKAGRSFHRGNAQAAKAALKWLRIRLGRVMRDVERKIGPDTCHDARLQALFAEPLARAAIIRDQKTGDKDRLYAFHAPEVECIGKGKTRKRFEFGVKVSVATTNARAPGGQFVVGAMTAPGRPYDGHTLAAQLEQTTRITGVDVERAYVDRGYKGHDAPDKDKVFISGQKDIQSPTIKRELKRRSAVEPVIGHMKDDGHLGRCFLKGPEGDAINAILAAVGHNLRLLARWLILFLLWIGLIPQSSRRCHRLIPA